MQRKQVICKVNDILDTYCTDCFLKQFLRQTYGKNHAQRFCIRECSVGEELQKYGDKLLKKT
ncbi:zinc-finger domain-containing protein [Pueribacillus theae]|uniref:Zinc-finger domain-containing protein n=1 Tax=Pueribacillus theae TaxID=2171751 RepID=A0A2U1K6W3_9BACI|nr:zinc-finger domain-containing protein [Pueribacillus theae]PWA13270.1 zinc-finger domain-containing protein [Pueribacillus theae]